MSQKECFGQLANMKIAYNNSTQKHYLRTDDEKLRECDACSLFNKCMFLRYNELMKQMLEMVDDAGSQAKSRRLG